MRERPILFDGPSVRAILDGRKSQTRRLVKPQPEPDCSDLPVEQCPGEPEWFTNMRTTFGTVAPNRMEGDYPGQDFALRWWRCPYGQLGDRLWVRETWQICAPSSVVNGEPTKAWTMNRALRVVYRATANERHPDHPEWGNSRWKSAMHMPRHASRITLEVVGVRVERVQDISEVDAIAEGRSMTPSDERGYFPETWEAVNGERGYGWNANPWVWVVEFKVVKP